MNLVPGILSPALFAPRDNGDGFPTYVAAAAREGKDVNDWIEARLGWVPALPVLEQHVFPFIVERARICEVGVGTGRWSRHIAARIPDGQLLLVDRSPWIVAFLRNYFKQNRNVKSVIGDGVTIPAEAQWADMIFSQGMFITLKLGHILAYLRNFSRTLKLGGLAIFDFVDPQTPEGWQFLLRESARAHDVFTYHTTDVIRSCCEQAGLTVDDVSLVGKSTYIRARKTGQIA